MEMCPLWTAAELRKAERRDSLSHLAPSQTGRSREVSALLAQAGVTGWGGSRPRVSRAEGPQHVNKGSGAKFPTHSTRAP